MNLVLDPAYEELIEDPTSFLITEDDVRHAWNFVNLTTRQRIAFENDKEVNKVCSRVLGWKRLGLQEDEDEDEDYSDDEDNKDELVSA